MRNTLRISLLMLVFAVPAAPAAHAKEVKVPLDKVPKAVLDAIKAKFPGAKLREAEKETEDGKTTYEVSVEHKGREYSVAATAEGTITEIEREIEIKDLPKAVTDAIKKKYPNGQLEDAEEVTANDRITYEVIVESSKEERKLMLDANGKILEDELEEEEKEEDDEK